MRWRVLYRGFAMDDGGEDLLSGDVDDKSLSTALQVAAYRMTVFTERHSHIEKHVNARRCAFEVEVVECH